MIGYKALNADMTNEYGNMTYELGKWYQIEGELKMCENGFHFCNTLEETLRFYPLKGSRFFKVEADGEIITSSEKNVAEKIKLVEEVQITDEILNTLVNSKKPNIRYKVAEYGRSQDLDILVHDENWYVRSTVARQKRDKDLDILVKDKCIDVRCMVVCQGRNKDLDILVHDENWYVRSTVACQGRNKDLDILVKDENIDVRCAVARQRRPQDLDILVNDKNWYVRQIARKLCGGKLY